MLDTSYSIENVPFSVQITINKFEVARKRSLDGTWMAVGNIDGRQSERIQISDLFSIFIQQSNK